MDLAALRRKRATVAVEYDGDTANVSYHPNAVSDDDVKLFATVSEKKVDEALASLIAPLARMIVDWDLTWDGNPLVADEKGITQLPPLMRLGMFGAIVKDFFDRGNGRASGATSPEAVALEATIPTTPISSAAPNGQALPPGLSLVSPRPQAG